MQQRRSVQLVDSQSWPLWCEGLKLSSLKCALLHAIVWCACPKLLWNWCNSNVPNSHVDSWGIGAFKCHKLLMDSYRIGFWIGLEELIGMSKTPNGLLLHGWPCFGFKVSQTPIELLATSSLQAVYVIGTRVGLKMCATNCYRMPHQLLALTAKSNVCRLPKNCYGTVMGDSWLTPHFAVTCIHLPSLDFCLMPASLLMSIKLLLELLKWPILARFAALLKITARKDPKAREWQQSVTPILLGFRSPVWANFLLASTLPQQIVT